jgi:hypothetical protein
VAVAPGAAFSSKGSTMATSPMAELFHQLRRTVLLLDGAGLSDGELLEEYVGSHDETALAALVQRHGPMVWGVCRRVLGNYHDLDSGETQAITRGKLAPFRRSWRKQRALGATA